MCRGRAVQGDFRIGERLVQPRINSVQHQGSTVHLEPKVMQVLLVLASKPGEVFTREQIREVVWRDVFVGDDVLMRAISEIRRVFQDDPRVPHTVQTVPKMGYRLIAPVVQLSETATLAQLEKAEQAPSPGTPELTTQLPKLLPATPHEIFVDLKSRSSRWPLWLGALAAAVLLVSGILAGAPLLRKRSAAEASSPYISRPLTTYPGSQLQPALSPEGDAAAFVWARAGQGNHIYLKSLHSGAPVRLTSGTDQELSPAWSPDGRSIAFIRHSDRESTIEVIPSVGGSERRVYTLPVNSVWEYGGLTWSHDGESLIFPDETRVGGPSGLVELSLADRAVRQLTRPPAEWNGDWMPALSPDGAMLAFARGAEMSTRDLYVMKLPDGEPRRVTTDAHLIVGLTWTADGASIVFSSNRGGTLGLWRVSAQGGTPERESAGSDDAYSPMIASHGNLLAYSHGSASWTIAAIALDGTKAEAVKEADVLTSSEQDSSPQVSPDGRKLAFQSWRSGTQEIWTSDVDGSDPDQLTTQGASAGSPAWSHDGRTLAFDARPGGFAHIYLIDADGGSPRALTAGNFNDVVPSWSADGHWIYFGSTRSGSWQIWKTSPDGHGAPQQVTFDGGMVAKESTDGKWLYIVRFAEPGLWRQAVTGAPEQKMSIGPPLGEQNYWTVFDNSLYVLTNLPGRGNTLVRLDPATERVTPVYTLKHEPDPFAGLTITPDGRHLLFAELTQAESNITLVENFR